MDSRLDAFLKTRSSCQCLEIFLRPSSGLFRETHRNDWHVGRAETSLRVFKRALCRRRSVPAVVVNPAGTGQFQSREPGSLAQRRRSGRLSRLGRTIMKSLKPLFIFCSLILASTVTARAEDKCESTEHNVAHKISGKDYVCDKCVVLGCDTSGKNIGKCTRTTKYTNCVEPAKPADKKK
jgi:hypothetical protein